VVLIETKARGRRQDVLDAFDRWKCSKRRPSDAAQPPLGPLVPMPKAALEIEAAFE